MKLKKPTSTATASEPASASPQVGPNGLLDLLDTIRSKYLAPSEFWSLYDDSYQGLRVLTVNVEMLRVLLQDRRILDAAEACTVDSAVLAVALRRIYGQPVVRLTGREIVEHSPNHIARRAVCLFGASAISRAKALTRYKMQGAGSQQVLAFEEPVDLTGSVLDRPRTRIAGFFAYGFPKQEERIHEFLALNPSRPAILIGIGGAIDYFSGTVRRPPELVARIGLEWLWRLTLQPKLRASRIVGVVPIALRLLAYGARTGGSR